MSKQMWNEIPAGRVNRAIQQFLYALGGDAGKVIGRMCDDDLAIELAIFAKEEKMCPFEPTTSQELAREIMGKNFFGIGEAIKHFGVKPSKQQTADLAEIPFTEGVLESLKDTHILVAVFPMSILDIRKTNGLLFDLSTRRFYESEKFAKKKGSVGWYLIQKTPVKDSTFKNWGGQQALLSDNDETPTSQVMVYTIIGHYKATDERLFKNIYVSCSDVDSVGNRVRVIFSASDGLVVDSTWLDSHDPSGLSSARKS